MNENELRVRAGRDVRLGNTRQNQPNGGKFVADLKRLSGAQRTRKSVSQLVTT